MINIDLLCKDLLSIGNVGFQAIIDRYGNRFLTENGEIDRISFRTALFNDEIFRLSINELIHPLARAALHEACDALEKTVVLAEVPLLYEAGWLDDFCEIIVVYASKPKCLERVIARDGVTAKEALRSYDSQMSLEQKALLANHVINNNGSWIDTIFEAIHLSKIIREKYFS